MLARFALSAIFLSPLEILFIFRADFALFQLWRVWWTDFDSPCGCPCLVALRQRFSVSGTACDFSCASPVAKKAQYPSTHRLIFGMICPFFFWDHWGEWPGWRHRVWILPGRSLQFKDELAFRRFSLAHLRGGKHDYCVLPQNGVYFLSFLDVSGLLFFGFCWEQNFR